jgi:hypothetical protein
VTKKIIIGMAGILSIYHFAWASGPGTTGGNVLSMPVGARAIAMGEAFTSIADDSSSLYWNPAGIALLNQSEATFMYNQSYQDMSYSHSAFGLSMENGGIAGSAAYLGFGKIDGFDSTGNPAGNVEAYNGVASVGGGILLDAFSAGMTAKAVHGVLADTKANGAAADFGTTFVYPSPVFGGATLRLGATLRNLGTGMKYLDQRDPFPTEFRLGASLLQLQNQRLNLGMDFGKARGDKSALYAGAEYWLNRVLALRVGYTGNHTESNGIRAGIGLKIRDLSFDYAYASYGDLGLTHRYELTYRFGEIRPRLTPEERKLYRQAKNDIRNERYGQALLVMDSLMRMEPKYRPFHNTYKTALKGVEQQDKLAKNLNTFSLTAPSNKQAAGPGLTDLDDLEQLLVTSDEKIAQNSTGKAQAGVKR